jgi:hypothetical protein
MLLQSPGYIEQLLSVAARAGTVSENMIIGGMLSFGAQARGSQPSQRMKPKHGSNAFRKGLPQPVPPVNV